MAHANCCIQQRAVLPPDTIRHRSCGQSIKYVPGGALHPLIPASNQGHSDGSLSWFVRLALRLQGSTNTAERFGRWRRASPTTGAGAVWRSRSATTRTRAGGLRPEHLEGLHDDGFVKRGSRPTPQPLQPPAEPRSRTAMRENRPIVREAECSCVGKRKALHRARRARDLGVRRRCSRSGRPCAAARSRPVSGPWT